jgi:hypothetical protein
MNRWTDGQKRMDMAAVLRLWIGTTPGIRCSQFKTLSEQDKHLRQSAHGCSAPPVD